MTSHLKPLSLFLLFIFIIFSGRNFAQLMKLVSASVHQFQILVLKGKETNQVIQIKIETEGAKTNQFRGKSETNRRHFFYYF